MSYFLLEKKYFFKKYPLGSEDLINMRLTSPKSLLVLNLKPRYAKNSDFLLYCSYRANLGSWGAPSYFWKILKKSPKNENLAWDFFLVFSDP